MPETLAYTIADFARVASVGKTTLYEEIAAGRLIAAKIGSKTLIPADRGREWLKSREVAAVAPSRNPTGRSGKGATV